MATETHIDEVYPSGQPPEMNEQTRVVLVSSMGTVFLKIGAPEAKEEDMTIINIGINGGKELRKQLKWALGNVGGLDPSEF